MSLMGQKRRIGAPDEFAACPLRSDRVRTFALQRIDAVCQGPTHAPQQTAQLLDHLVRAQQDACRHLKAKRLRCFEVDHQFELGRLLRGEIMCVIGHSARSRRHYSLADTSVSLALIYFIPAPPSKVIMATAFKGASFEYYGRQYREIFAPPNSTFDR